MSASRLVIVSASDRIIEQLAVTDITEVVGHDAVHPGDERVGAALEQALADAVAWVESRR